MSATSRHKMDNKNDECSQRIKSYKNTRHGTPEGTRYTKVLPPSSRRQATVHRTVAFEFSSPFYLEYKNGVSPKGYTRNKMFPFHPHPYGVRLE